MSMRTKVILGALLINAITFIIARCWWGLRGSLAATLEAHINDPNDKTMTYLIAGNLNQADTAFKFMEPFFGSNYTFVQFSTKGWSAQATAERIAQDIQENGYQAQIFTISLGDHVARYLEQELGNAIKIYAINPCPNRSVLQKPWGTILKYVAPFAEILCHSLGWVSYLPIVPSFGGNYSPILLIDQFRCIYYDDPPRKSSHTYGVICSNGDTFLDNATIEKFYLNAEIEHIDAGHSDIVDNADLYYNAISNLLETD